MTVITRFFHTTTVASIIFANYTVNSLLHFTDNSKTCVKRPLKNRQNLDFNDKW